MRKYISNILGMTIVTLAVVSSSASDRNPILNVADGMPKVAEVIGDESFVPVTVEKLKNAKIWYVDYEWHRQHGIDVPANGVDDPKFAKQVLDAYAWQSRGADDHDGQYTGEKKTFYADYYGGWGLGVNVGSGRAAGMGLVQAKGLKTSMVKETDPWHSNGAVQTIEAVDESIWSQILDSEMTFGANKVVAVILTGTYAEMKDSKQIFPRALIVREMALRPAHFMLNSSRNRLADQKRVAGTMNKFLQALPYPQGYKPSSDQDALRTGIFEFIDREAKTQAEYYAKRLYFGSESPSNLEIQNRRLDLGDHTAQEGYSAIYRDPIDQDRPFGTSDVIKFNLRDMRRSWAQTLPANLRNVLPTQKEMDSHYDSKFEFEKQIELAKLSGAPANLVEKLQDKEEVHEFGKLLLELAKAGNDHPVATDPDGWENTGYYNINKLLVDLAKVETNNFAELVKVASGEKNIGQELGYDIAVMYLHFKNEIAKAAAKDGVSEAALSRYMKINSQSKNKTLSNLIRGHRRWHELWATTDKGIVGDPKVIEHYIDNQVSQAVSTFKDLDAYQAVIRNEASRAEGMKLYEVFDARTGKIATLIRVSTASGMTHVNGINMTSAEIENSSLRLNKGASAQAKKVNGAVEFYFEGLRNANLKDFEIRKSNIVEMRSRDKAPSGNEAQCRAIFRSLN